MSTQVLQTFISRCVVAHVYNMLWVMVGAAECTSADVTVPFWFLLSFFSKQLHQSSSLHPLFRVTVGHNEYLSKLFRIFLIFCVLDCGLSIFLWVQINFHWSASPRFSCSNTTEVLYIRFVWSASTFQNVFHYPAKVCVVLWNTK